MKYERDGLLLPKTAQMPIDIEIFDLFQHTHKGLRETYKVLTPNSDKKQEAAESWPLGKNVDLRVDDIDIDDLLSRQDSLRDFKKDLLSDDDFDQDAKQLYRWKINEDIANINMIVTSKAGDMRNFHRWNEFIYGRPNEQIYRAALDWVAKDAENLLAVDNQSPIVSSSAEKVLYLLKDKRGDSDLLVPDPELFETVRKDHMKPLGYYSLLLAGVEIPDQKITKDIGDKIVKHVVKENLKSNYKVATTDGTTWGISHFNEEVETPSKYNLPVQRFKGLALGHEIGSHLLEKVNGERGPLLLASVGLDRHEFNEGRAIIREQVQYEAFDEFGKLVRWRDILRRHIAISYASGIGENSPRDSVNVYNFMNAIDTMYQSKLTPDDMDTTNSKAAKKTSALLTRVLKGTDGNGGAYLKDKVYLEGLVSNWLTASEKGVSSISDGDLGKFDINNSRHISSLIAIGLLPNNK